MKGTILKIMAVVLIAMVLAAPVSARTAEPPVDRVVDQTPVLPAGSSTLVDWFEDWDSYPTGQNMHGIGGWKGWGNDPLYTAYTTDVQFTSSPNSIDINGNSDLVHEYAIADGVWTYTAWQYIPANLTGITYFILLNQYDDGGATNNWSVQVEFDAGTDLVINDGPAGGTLPIIYDTWVEIAVVIDLDADWQEFYYGGNLLFAGSWSEGLSGGGITSIGAVDLFANGATPVYYDDLSLVQAGQNPMYGKIKMLGKMQGGAYIVAPIVRFVDEDGAPIMGCEVTMFLKKPSGNTKIDTRLTNEYGRAAFPMASPIGGYWLACIDDAQHPDYVWDDSGPKCAFLEFPAP